MRKFFVLTVAVVLTVLTAAPAMAQELRIRGSAGGRIGDYLQLYMQVRDDGRRVVIDGPCFSACTLVLSVVPRDRICATSRAVLGFHAAWMPDENGRPRRHATGTRLLMDTYPPAVKRWIRRNGGLTGRTIVLRGRALRGIVRGCA